MSSMVAAIRARAICYCLAGILTVFLSGCLSTAISSANMVYNRHSLNNTLRDSYSTLIANNALYANQLRFPDTHINVTVFNNILLLTGQCPTYKMRKEIVLLIKRTIQPQEVYNFITIGPTSSPLVRVSDTWITTKINSQFIADEDMDPTQTKIVTENGSVFLLGVVAPTQADVAVRIARNTMGVQNVINLFSYIHISRRYKE